MATNNNKQQKGMQLQDMLGLQLRSRDSHAGNSVSVIIGEDAYSQKVQPDRGHPTSRYAPTGLTGQLRPLLARRDNQVTYRGPDTDGSPISRLVQSIGTGSDSAAGRSKISSAADNPSSSEFGQDRQSTICSGLDTVRPVLKMFLRPNTNLETYTMESEVGCDFVNSGQTAVCNKSATNVRISHKSSQENVKRECTEFRRNEELQQGLLSDKELELQQIYQFQQHERDRTKKLNAQVQKDIELQLSQARQELELQRRKNAELERDLMKHRDVYQEMALQQILEDEASKGARKNWSSQLDEDEYETALDRSGSKRDQNRQLCSATGQSTLQHVPDTGLMRNQQRNSVNVPLQAERLDPPLNPRRTKPGTSDERLAQLLVMQKLEALKQKFDSATETPSVSDLEERMVRGERHYERRSVRRSDSDNDSDLSGRSENSQHEELNSQHQRLDRHGMHHRLRNNWQANGIGDAFRNQSSLMQMVETAASVNQSPELAQNRRGFESDAGTADMEITGRRLRSRLDFDRFHQRDTGDDSSPMHRQQDYRYSSFQEKNGQLFDRAQQIHQRRMESQLYRLRSRSCERVNSRSRSRHSSALLMSSSSGRPIGMGLNRLLEESMDSDGSQKGYVRNVMEVDVSYTSSEEESGDEAEKTIRRQNQRRSEDQLSPPPSDDDANTEPSQKGTNRRNSRRSLRSEDDDTMDENTRRSIGNKDVAANSDSKSPIHQSGKQIGNYPGINKMIPRRSIGSEDAQASSDPSSRRRNSTKIPETENVKDTSRPRRSIGNDDEMASTDQRYPKRQSQKLSETDKLQDESRSVPRRSIGQDEKMGYTDPVRQPEKQFKNLKGVPRRSIGNEDEIDYDDQSRLNKQPEKRQSPLEIMSSSSPGKSDPGRKNQNLPPNRKSGKVAGNGGAGRRNSESNGPQSIPEEWSGRPAVSQYPSLSDDNSNTDENAQQRRDLKMFKLPDPQKRVVLDSDDDDIDEEEERRRRLRRKPSRRPSKLSVTSKTSRNAEPQTTDDHRESRTIETATDDNPSDRPRRHSEKSIKPIASTTAAAVDGGKNVDSRFQDARKAAGQLNTEIDMPSKELKSRKNSTLQSFDSPQRHPTTPNSKNDARQFKDNDSDVQLALKEKTLNTSMKLGIAGEQTELQPTQEEEEEPNSALSGQRNSWRSKHNKAAPDSYTQDSEHRGLHDDTRDTDSDTRSTLPPQDSYALRPEAGGKVQLLASRFLQHQAKVQQKQKKAEESADASSENMKREASKPGAAATSKVRDDKPAVSIQEKKALVKSVSRLPATEGGAVQVKPEDTLSEEDIEACKTRAQLKNEERRKRRENKEAAHTAPVSEDEDDDEDLAPVMQQERMGEQLRPTPKEPEDGDVAPMTGDAPVKPGEKPGGTEGVMALERQRIQEKQQAKPRARKPSKPKDESHVAQAPIAPERPHKRRRRRRSSRVEPLARSVSLPPQPTVIYCCPPCPPCPPRCCYPAAYCSVGCRRC